MLARQALYHLSHFPSPFALVIFHAFCLALALDFYPPLPPTQLGLQEYSVTVGPPMEIVKCLLAYVDLHKAGPI
jgi:hypothetical protein